MAITRLENGKYQFRRVFKKTGTREECRAFERWLKDATAAGFSGSDTELCAATIRQAMPRFLSVKEKKDRLAPNTIKDYRRDLSRFAVDLSKTQKDLIGDIYLDSITFDALEDWQIARAEEVSPGTINKEISKLKHFARWCIKRGIWQASEQAVSWLMIDDIRENPKQPEPIPQADLERVIRALPDHIGAVLWTMAIVCDRPGALCAANWGDIIRPDKKQGRPGRLILRDRKGYLPRHLAIWPGSIFEDCLRIAREIYIDTTGSAPTADDPIFISSPNGRQGSRWTSAKFDNAIRYHLRRSRLPKQLKGFTPYVVRHSLMTWAAMDGASTYDRQMLAGHKRETTCQIYTHVAGMQADRVRGQMEQSISESFRPILERKGGGVPSIDSADLLPIYL